MKIYAQLPLDRFNEGTIYATNDGGDRVFLEPSRSRGEADNTGAAAHGNVQEDPTRAYGDHPFGVYMATGVTWIHDEEQRKHYGPCFIRLEPVAGEAEQAKRNGRTGFGIHGGLLHDDGRLRETFGCNRVEDATAARLGALVDAELSAGRQVRYECAVAR